MAGLCIMIYRGAEKAHAQSAVLMTLPAECRPIETITTPMVVYNLGYGEISLNAVNGEVRVNSISNTSAAESICFTVVYPIA